MAEKKRAGSGKKEAAKKTAAKSAAKRPAAKKTAEKPTVARPKPKAARWAPSGEGVTCLTLRSRPQGRVNRRRRYWPVRPSTHSVRGVVQ